MNETQHIIYERLFICSTSATHQHIHKNIWTGELQSFGHRAATLVQYGLAPYAKTW
jgi:hypothetical protein